MTLPPGPPRYEKGAWVRTKTFFAHFSVLLWCFHLVLVVGMGFGTFFEVHVASFGASRVYFVVGSKVADI